MLPIMNDEAWVNLQTKITCIYICKIIKVTCPVEILPAQNASIGSGIWEINKCFPDLLYMHTVQSGTKSYMLRGQKYMQRCMCSQIRIKLLGVTLKPSVVPTTFPTEHL